MHVFYSLISYKPHGKYYPFKELIFKRQLNDNKSLMYSRIYYFWSSSSYSVDPRFYLLSFFLCLKDFVQHFLKCEFDGNEFFNFCMFEKVFIYNFFGKCHWAFRHCLSWFQFFDNSLPACIVSKDAAWILTFGFFGMYYVFFPLDVFITLCLPFFKCFGYNAHCCKFSPCCLPSSFTEILWNIGL